MGIREVIKNSVESGASIGKIEARQRQNRQIPSVHRRLAVQSIDSIEHLGPRIRFAGERRRMRHQGLDYIASGAESWVVRTGNVVRKYVTGSETWSAFERQGVVDRKRRDFDAMREHMSAFVLDQTISVGEHPLYEGLEVVQIEQAFLPFDPLLQSTDFEGGMLIAPVSERAVFDGLSNFIDSTHHLYDAYRLLPDTYGFNNVVQHEGRVILLDSQPIGREKSRLQELIKLEIVSLAKALEKPPL